MPEKETIRVVSPPLSELARLRTPLTTGEDRFLSFLLRNLPPAWEIYIQPHLNGLRPDFVLLHPSVGIAVFEVKDWSLDAMRYIVHHPKGTPPRLMGEKDGIRFSLQHDNSVEKVQLYKEEIHNLYCPRTAGKAGYAIISAGVVFPCETTSRVIELLRPFRTAYSMDQTPQYYPVVGKDILQSDDILRVFPEVQRKASKYMSDETAADLRNWLVEPEVSAEQRQPLDLNSDQKKLVTTRTNTGYRKIKGPAGSGKSLVLAARAAQLTSEGKSVLVVAYNITLLNYLMDLAVRWPNGRGRTRDQVTWLNFHHWCKRVSNHHVIADQAQADNTDYEFMAEGAECSTDCAQWFACPGTVAAASGTLVQTDLDIDYSLVLLPVNVSPTYGYLQVRLALPDVGERIFIPQHPLAWGKQIAVTSDLDEGGFCLIHSLTEPTCFGGSGDIGYFADTEPGSSGSPVISYDDYLVVALHHCGGDDGACPNRGVRIPEIVDQLSISGNLPDNALPPSPQQTCLVDITPDKPPDEYHAGDHPTLYAYVTDQNENPLSNDEVDNWEVWRMWDYTMIYTKEMIGDNGYRGPGQWEFYDYLSGLDQGLRSYCVIFYHNGECGRECIDLYVGISECEPVQVQSVSAVPDVFPAGESTTISYALSLDAKVTDQVVDSIGGLVNEILTAEDQAAGEHQVVWDGTYDGGGQAPPGDYTVSIRGASYGSLMLSSEFGPWPNHDALDLVVHQSNQEVLIAEYVDMKVHRYTTSGTSVGYIDTSPKYPMAIEVDTSGFVYIMDRDDRIKKYSASYGLVSDFWWAGSSGDSLQGALFYSTKGYFWVSDNLHNRIVKLDMSGLELDWIAIDSSDEVTGRAVDSNGHLWAAFSENCGGPSEGLINEYSEDGDYLGFVTSTQNDGGADLDIKDGQLLYYKSRWFLEVYDIANRQWVGAPVAELNRGGGIAGS